MFRLFQIVLRKCSEHNCQKPCSNRIIQAQGKGDVLHSKRDVLHPPLFSPTFSFPPFLLPPPSLPILFLFPPFFSLSSLPLLSPFSVFRTVLHVSSHSLFPHAYPHQLIATNSHVISLNSLSLFLSLSLSLSFSFSLHTYTHTYIHTYTHVYIYIYA